VGYPGLKGWLKIVNSAGVEIMNLNGVQANNTPPHWVFSDTWRTTNDMAFLEWVDIGAPTREETWVHPAGGSSYIGRIIDRPVQMGVTIHLMPHVSHAALRESARAIRNQFEFSAGFLEFGESSNDFMRYRIYPSVVPSPFRSNQLDGALITSQYRVLDWTIDLWRDPYPVGGKIGGSNDPAAGQTDINHLPVL
jgi:hypothetical protein